MNSAFLEIVNMSIAASWLVLALVMLRPLLKRAPKWVSILLWGFVALRLVCPWSMESALSLIPSAETIPMDIAMDTSPEIHSGLYAVNSYVNPIIADSNTPAPGASANPWQIYLGILEALWLLGLILMLCYGLISTAVLRFKLREAVKLEDNVYRSERVTTPFVFGIFRPRIYLPFALTGPETGHVLAHERCHIRRRDYLWKPLGFLVLCLHWFNPLVWLAYILLCRDIELACDEKVIRELGVEQRAEYSEALLRCSIGRRSLAACPLAFGEVGVKQRIKSVLSYKKPAVWIIAAALLICVAVAVCFLTNPKDNPVPEGELEQGQYISYKEVYQPLYLSYFPIDGDSGMDYFVTEDSFIMQSRATGDRQVYTVDSREWQSFPWSDEEWAELFEFSVGYPTLEEYGQVLYLSVASNLFMLNVDGNIWLVSMVDSSKTGRHIDQIWQLVGKDQMGFADWQFMPAVSARLPIFRFEFEGDFDRIVVSSDYPCLTDYDATGDMGGSDRVELSGSTVYWTPHYTDALYAGDSSFSFSLSDENGVSYRGNVYITQYELGEYGDIMYMANIQGPGLTIRTNGDGSGAIITAN